jgi:hypothetical protein
LRRRLRTLRFERSARFDDDSGSKRRLDISPEDPDPTVFHGASVYYTKQAPLPSSQSNAVVLGSMTGFQAYFSGDKTAIYTELQIHVEKIFKGQLREIGSAIVVDEGGGAIRLPDGRVAKQTRFPMETDVDVGNRYVLFLTFDDKTQSFRIVKAWELKNGQAQPLAKTDLKDQKTGVSKYAGMPEVDFLNAVKQSVRRKGGSMACPFRQERDGLGADVASSNWALPGNPLADAFVEAMSVARLR